MTCNWLRICISTRQEIENSKFDAFSVFAFGGERTGILTTIEKLHFGFGDSERETQKIYADYICGLTQNSTRQQFDN